MLVFRSLTIGLLGACLYLLGGVTSLPPPEVVMQRIESPTDQLASVKRFDTPASSDNAVTVIDVAPRVPATTVASLVRLQPGERIAVVSDRHVANDLEAGMEIAETMRRGSQLLDLTVSGEHAGVRRVLVVLH